VSAQSYVFNPAEADESSLPRIYCFANGNNGWGWGGIAMAADGTQLAGHTSSSQGWLVHDLGIGEASHFESQRKKYAAHYPLGYVAEWVSYEDAPSHPELQRIYAAKEAA